MESWSQLPILRCRLCKKPFDTEASLKRHGYYCRKRKGENHPDLPRSCVPCARSKVRCDKLAPKCSKCATKNLDCRYPVSSTRNAESETHQVQDQDNVETSSLEAFSLSEPNTLDPQCTDITCILDLSDVRNEAFERNILDTPPVVSSGQEALPLEEIQITLPIAFSASSTSGADTASLQNFIIGDQLMTYATNNTPVPRHPTFNIRFLRTRPKLKAGAQITANNMARILCSYPKMMLDYNTIPPFIHPYWISASGSEESLEPLANCMSLLGMLGTRARGAASLFWRNVRMECDRISSTYTTFNRYEIVAATQALLIYMLVRVSEGETEHNNHDAAILGTVTLMCGELKRQLQSESPEVESLDMPYMYFAEGWSSWILEESRRRVATVFRIISMLVYISPATNCEMQPGLLLAPLPARKQLWEAADEEQWINELQRVPVANNAFGLAKSGDLIGLDEYQVMLLTMPGLVDQCTSTKSKDNWEAWFSGMDGFGALIMLTASLPT
ncbi:hypothetical protein EJ02DRAFT_384921 [Clathrospora elynae]|uniref:Zn(2)-C6 fungal-type domain-containing protein n=1 Tax=Clathrospora elynae TaxID=706981 RepID=A0A6A5SB50_9PLEO|nr:hypothetical protein EJ02DRAFT_384921 [Clathrospora elynae]